MNPNKPTTVETITDKFGNKEYIVDNPYLQWMNFSGTETPNNRKGRRNVCWRIPDPELAQKLAEDGYNVKHHSVRDGYEGEEYDYLQIQLNYRDKDGVPFAEKYPGLVPEVWKVDEDGYAILIGEDGVGFFDNQIITDAVLEFRRYDWNYNRKTGTTACIKRIFLTVKTDPIMSRFKFRNNTEPSNMDNLRNQGDDLPFDV